MMRLVTRSDFDGLVCAMILKEINLVDEIKFVHPKDVQDGKIELTSNDTATALPRCSPRTIMPWPPPSASAGKARPSAKYVVIVEYTK